MTRPSDLERALTAWFDEGPWSMPDRVVDAVADRISRQPQRRAWRLQRRPNVTVHIKLVAGLAAVLVLAVAGWSLLARQPGVGGTPSTVPSNSPAPSPSRASTPVPQLPSGSLAAGTYRFYPIGAVASLRVEAEIPAGWQGFGSWALLGPSGTAAPTGIGIGFLAANSIFRDPCHWDVIGDGSWPSEGDLAVGPSVDDLVSALAANPSYTATKPTDTVLATFPGKQVQLQLSTNIGSCDRFGPDGASRYFVFGGPDGGLYAQGPDNRWDVRVVDVGGTRLIVVVADYAGTSPSDRVAARDILDSLFITR